MLENRCLLDANAILRFLLQDNEEQFQYIRTVVKGENCYVTLEVLAEVCYVLEGLYQVSREDIVSNFRKLNNDVVLLHADVLLRALEIFDKAPKKQPKSTPCICMYECVPYNRGNTGYGHHRESADTGCSYIYQCGAAVISTTEYPSDFRYGTFSRK